MSIDMTTEKKISTEEMKHSEILREAAEIVLHGTIQNENVFICCIVDTINGYQEQREEKEAIKQRILEYMGIQNSTVGKTYFSYIRKNINPFLPYSCELSPKCFAFIQFMRYKLAIFLAEEYEAKGM